MQRKIIDYQIVWEKDNIRLSNSIRELLQIGWELFGYPMMDHIGNGYSQAIVKYQEDEGN
jgi:hypothetical protein